MCARCRSPRSLRILAPGSTTAWKKGWRASISDDAAPAGRRDFIPSGREFFRHFGLTERLARARPMRWSCTRPDEPGRRDRADDLDQSVIREQVEGGCGAYGLLRRPDRASPPLRLPVFEAYADRNVRLFDPREAHDGAVGRIVAVFGGASAIGTRQVTARGRRCCQG